MSRSTKKMATWTDFINADSSVPGADFDIQPSNGTSFGLDSFEFDERDNEGVEDAARLPETRGLSGLPDGIVTAGVPGMDMAELTASDDGIILTQEDIGLPKDAAIVNLQWLDPTQPQDPDRLPDNEETLDSVPQLEEAWGNNRQTDGVHLLPNQDLEAVLYTQSVRDSGGEPTSQLPGVRNAAEDDSIRNAVFQAVRRAHFGHPIAKIKQNLVDSLGDSASETRGIVAALEAEHGLIGNVYVRASVFPGLKNGEWVKEIRRGCRSARYVITDDATVATKLGMQQVQEVPWKAAIAHYKPLLAAAGYKLASGDPREVLRQAFLNGPRLAPGTQAPFPVEQHVEASSEDIQAELVAVKPEMVSIKTGEEKAIEDKHKAALIQIARWTKGGYLAREDALRLHSSRLSPEKLLRAASALMTATKNAPVYGGEGASLPEEARVARQKILASLEAEEKALKAREWGGIKAALERSIKAGLLTEEETQRITAMGKSASETKEIIAAAVLAARDQRVSKLTPVKAKDYSDVVLTDARPAAEQKRSSIEDKQAAIAATQEKKAKLALLKEIQSGRLTKDEARRIAAMGKSLEETERIIAAAVLAAPERRKAQASPVVAKTYQGENLTEHAQALRQASGEARVPPQDVQKLLRWAGQKMNEGSVGKEFDTYLTAKFSLPVLQAAAEPLKELRASREGLSGHLYVDAEAYASPEGSAGCEKHASKHRSSMVKMVLAMPRCDTCVFKNADGICSQYNKVLTKAPPVYDIKAYQEEMIHLADGTDAERTAALFDPSEYGLTNDSLDNVVATEMPTAQLSEVLFGEGSEM